MSRSAPTRRDTITFDVDVPISLSDVVTIADGARVQVTDAVLHAVADAASAADAIASATPAYGRSTGVGANRETSVTDASDHGIRLIRSHATDAGDDLPARTVRALIATRLAQLARAGSGIDPAILPALVDALDRDDVAEIGAVGSIGTADLAALAALGLTLAGERSAGSPVEPVRWGVESALPFLSSSALTIGRAILASAELRRLDRGGRIVFALTSAALRANPSALSDAAAAAAAAPHVEEVGAEIRGLLDGASWSPARIQDPFGFRVYPITQGALLTSLERLDAQLLRLLNAAQENPVFDVEAGIVTHHGAFFQAQLALDLDATNLAIAQSATNAHALLRLTNEPAFTGLAPFLATGPAGASGLMMLEYTAAAALAEIRNAATPASLGTIVLSRGTEEDASFATQGAVQLERAVASYRIVLACELIAVSRLLAQLDVEVPAPLTRAAAGIRALQPHQEDQDLRGPLQAAADLLDTLHETDLVP
ncbi:aromatic amino acid lyase [Agromyces albus]|uniref:aromatic amino acid lyase n=1 Tax=Agromyces albus TaxID=205332 RepID=UPI0019D6D05C|nr:aromatic amino acid lyase [Agromyces albus]